MVPCGLNECFIFQSLDLIHRNDKDALNTFLSYHARVFFKVVVGFFFFYSKRGVCCMGSSETLTVNIPFLISIRNNLLKKMVGTENKVLLRLLECFEDFLCCT